MTSFHNRFSALILAHLLASVLVGCSGERESETTATGESPAPEAAGRPAAIPDVGAEFPAPGQLPSNFPADVPTYPGATVQQSLAVPNHSMFVTFVTSASSEEVYEFYREQLQNRGWSISQAKDDEHYLTVNKEGRTTSIMIMASGAQTEIGISIQGG
jgi:hypothetical protein